MVGRDIDSVLLSQKFWGKSGIIYCPLAGKRVGGSWPRYCMVNGVSGPYLSMQDFGWVKQIPGIRILFLNGGCRCGVATIWCLEMGMNKPRFIHHDNTQSIESYYQETEGAGKVRRKLDTPFNSL